MKYIINFKRRKNTIAHFSCDVFSPSGNECKQKCNDMVIV